MKYKKTYKHYIAASNLSRTLSLPITFITDNKSGVLVEQHNCILKNIAKSPILPIYHHSLNVALLGANHKDCPISLS